MAARAKWLLAAAVVAGLIGLSFLAAFDGREHSELARFLGRFHPLSVHLPIALILLVPLLELAGRRESRAHLRHTAAFVLLLATICALASVALGWIHAWSGGFGGPLVASHYRAGLLLAAACVAALGCRAWLGPRKTYAALLVAVVALMGWTSHLGGSLTHGQTYLTRFMPARLRAALAIPAAPTSLAPPGSFYAVRIQPIFEAHCVTCHNPNQRKGELVLDSYENAIKGGEHGAVVRAGDFRQSELFTRITLPRDDKHFMPSEGKPPLKPVDIKLIELWIAAGASGTTPVGAIANAPVSPPPPRLVALAPDYRPRAAMIAALSNPAGVQLAPRSQVFTDGLILRTAADPSHCDDAALARLAPLADLIVDAELARTAVTDAGAKTIAGWPNLRVLDLTRTRVTGRGVSALSALRKLESLNLTETEATEASIAALRREPALKHVYSFNLKTAGSLNPLVP
ncbi:MAG: hypothetical protein JWM88_2134 [Verrucomicrobia bacterium]|nr:hypothetical protein [Verrucomicrobiota bacterium]